MNHFLKITQIFENVICMSFKVRSKLIFCLAYFYAENHSVIILQVYFAVIKVNFHFGN